MARDVLATALRKGRYQVNVLLGGYDTIKQTSALYWMDYTAALQAVPFGAQGYATFFCLGLMDRMHPGKAEECTYEQALEIIQACIQELQTRFLPSHPNFIIKKVDADGISVVSYGSDPADT
jgi:20S proteasome subunit beta 4